MKFDEREKEREKERGEIKNEISSIPIYINIIRNPSPTIRDYKHFNLRTQTGEEQNACNFALRH